MIKTLIVGCGPNPARRPTTHEETMLDIRQFNGVDIAHDLNQFPWPFEDDQFDEVVGLHVLEHLQSFLDFHNEAWRVLRPGGHLYLETPLAGGNWDLTHADPTHVRCYRPHSWINYLTRAEGPKFGYTDRFWCIMHLAVIHENIHVHLSKVVES